jgi:sec-independent protein translocase protein TatA
MHLPGVFQILVIALIVLLLFGRGRVSESLGEFGKGVKSFRKGLNDAEPPTPLAVEADAVANPADN